MKLVVHIGSHKAGSTAIQSVSASKKEYLLENGIYYPTGLFPNYPDQHSELNLLISTNDSAKISDALFGAAQQAKDREARCIFLSGEDLCAAANEQGLQAFAKHATDIFDEIEIVLVLRRKEDYLLSHYNHFLRHATQPIGVKEFCQSVSFSPRKTIERWREAFGASSVSLVRYDDVENGKPFVERFFLEILGIRFTAADSIASDRINASYDMASTFVLNDALKQLPDFDLRISNGAYIRAFRGTTIRLPFIERDLKRLLCAHFPDEDWQIPELPHLCDQAPAASPMGADQAKDLIIGLESYFGALREAYAPQKNQVINSNNRLGTITELYETMLDRTPNEDELKRLLRSQKSKRDLRQMILNSPEFRRKHTERLNVAALDLPPLDVQVAASDEEIARMYSHLQTKWTGLGETQSYWSVDSQPHFKGPVDKDTEDEFLKIGEDNFHTFEMTLARAGFEVADFDRLVDFGCGLGRFSIPAASAISEVVAVDFSRTHIQRARKIAQNQDIENITWKVIASPDEKYADRFDIWYSRIVLQHNPPTIMCKLLKNALTGLRKGGIAVFQVPTYSVNYSFSASSYLSTLDTQPDIEMHCLPQSILLDLLRECSCKVLEIREDSAVDIPRYWVSNTITAQKV